MRNEFDKSMDLGTHLEADVVAMRAHSESRCRGRGGEKAKDAVGLAVAGNRYHRELPGSKKG